MRGIFAWIHKYERHLSALAMVAGFVADNLIFWRVDLLQTQLVFAGYALACFISIPLLHSIEARASRGRPHPRIKILLQLVIQFALGGFWSGFVIFYGRSAVLGASWPFLLFLFLVFLGSEYFHKYHARIVFTSVLFFFALYSYAIFAVPIYTGALGTKTFILSGIVTVGIFALFTMFLRFIARERFLQDVWRIRVGAFGVLIAMNVFYFTNILPPLPLSGEAGGVYHLVTRIPGAYLGASEAEPWQVMYLGFVPTLHVVSGEVLYAYSAVFAPTGISTTVVHEWQWYNPAQKAWVTMASVAYTIVGGRDGGYRGYSKVAVTQMGQWRVNIETVDNRLIDQLPFTAVQTDILPETATSQLK